MKPLEKCIFGYVEAMVRRVHGETETLDDALRPAHGRF